jgi:TPR repeat protein
MNMNVNLNEPDEDVPVGDHIGLYELSIMINKRAWALDEEDGDFEEAEREYMQAAQLNNDYAMMNLAILHEKNDGDSETILMWYKRAIATGHCVVSMYNLADYYQKIGDIQNMLHYYQMATDRGDPDSMRELAHHYYNLGNHDEFRRYYTMAMRQPKFKMTKAIQLFNPFVVVKLIQSIIIDPLQDHEFKEKMTAQLASIHTTYKPLIIYNNKITLFERLNHVVECGICYETRLNIDLACAHCVCTDCYTMLHLALKFWNSVFSNWNVENIELVRV